VSAARRERYCPIPRAPGAAVATGGMDRGKFRRNEFIEAGESGGIEPPNGPKSGTQWRHVARYQASVQPRSPLVRKCSISASLTVQPAGSAASRPIARSLRAASASRAPPVNATVYSRRGSSVVESIRHPSPLLPVFASNPSQAIAPPFAVPFWLRSPHLSSLTFSCRAFRASRSKSASVTEGRSRFR
jgi:hypothetical protein